MTIAWFTNHNGIKKFNPEAGKKRVKRKKKKKKNFLKVLKKQVRLVS